MTWSSVDQTLFSHEEPTKIQKGSGEAKLLSSLSPKEGRFDPYDNLRNLVRINAPDRVLAETSKNPARQ